MNLDILKLIVVLLSLLYLNLKIKPQVSSVNYRIMNVGLFLLLFSSLLDFTDGVKNLNYILILGKKSLFHDIIEDQFSNTPGFALFVLGAFREIMSVKRNIKKTDSTIEGEKK